MIAQTRREIVALFGQPVSENPTEAMLEAAFRHHGLAWVYHSFEVPPPELEAAVKRLREEPLPGADQLPFEGVSDPSDPRSNIGRSPAMAPRAETDTRREHV